MTVYYTIVAVVLWIASGSIMAPIIGAFIHGGRSDEVTFGECWW